jgi:hypothetical protein
MKSRELLSIVLSLIMVFGVTAGSAYAQTDEVDIDDSVEIEAFDDAIEEEHEDETDNDRDDETKDDNDDDRDDDKDDSRDGKYDHDDKLDRYCEMTDEEKRQLFADHPKFEEFADRMANLCDLSGDEREDAIDALIRDKLTQYCEMTDEEKRDLILKYDKAEDHIEKMNAYCELDDDARDAYIKDHKDEYKMKHDQDMDKGKHMDYDRLCALSESDRALEFDDSEKLERISNWCDTSPEEREDFKKENHDMNENDMKEKRQEALDRIQDNPNVPQRIKEMIMEKRDIVDDRHEEIRMKYEEKHGDFDEKKSELKIKFKNHMATMKIEISEERKSAIQDRVAEMKAFKMELRENSSELTDEEKQELRAEFVEKAKDIRLAWVSPRHQMNAGIDAAEIECREGFSHVLKESNGKAMCLKADTALKMIERGIVVPAI